MQVSMLPDDQVRVQFSGPLGRMAGGIRGHAGRFLDRVLHLRITEFARPEGGANTRRSKRASPAWPISTAEPHRDDRGSALPTVPPRCASVCGRRDRNRVRARPRAVGGVAGSVPAGQTGPRPCRRHRADRRRRARRLRLFRIPPCGDPDRRRGLRSVRAVWSHCRRAVDRFERAMPHRRRQPPRRSTSCSRRRPPWCRLLCIAEHGA